MNNLESSSLPRDHLFGRAGLNKRGRHNNHDDSCYSCQTNFGSSELRAVGLLTNQEDETVEEVVVHNQPRCLHKADQAGVAFEYSGESDPAPRQERRRFAVA